MSKQTFTEPLFETEKKPSIQEQLGLSMPDPVEARKTVYEYFDAYRTCRRLLGRQFVEHVEVKAVRGYAFAMNPDDVRVERVHPNAPKGFSDPQSDEDLLSPKEMQWLRFVQRMDERVSRLHPAHAVLVRHRFLDHDPTPSDESTYRYWCEQGWAWSFRKFEKVKREAVQMIAAALDASS